MKEPQDETIEIRSRTDASLNAERSSSRSADEALADAIANRVLDDVIERGRILADGRLFRFRARADELLTSERLAAPARSSETTQDRRRADVQMKAERNITDTLLEEARDGADLRASDRRERDLATHTHQQALIHDTDVSLEAERDRVTVDRGRRKDRLAMVSHDLRSPLAIITLSAGFLLEDSKDATTTQVVQDIDRAAARMERLILDLLDVARVEAGNLHMVKADHDVRALLGEMADCYRSLFEDRDLSFEVEAPSTPVVAPFDHDRIVQVVSNLLGNALKFTPGNGTVSLLARATANEVEFEVRDSGAGIPAEALPHLFERFWQVDASHHRGLGLGLYICREIIEQHEGRIWVESEVGVGTTVHFTLPTQAPASARMSA